MMNRLVRASTVQSTSRTGRSISSPTFNHSCRSLSSSSLTSKTSPSSSSGRIASRRLYRILQRQCNEFVKTLQTMTTPLSTSEDRQEAMLLLQPKLNPSQMGSHRVFPIKTIDSSDDIWNLLVFFRDWNEDEGEDEAWDWYDLIDKSGIDNNDERSASSLDRDFTDEPTLWTSVASIQRAIRYAFRHANSNKAEDNTTTNNNNNKNDHRILMNKFAIKALRMLLDQAAMWRLSSVSHDKDVRVVATSRYVGSRLGSPESSRGAMVVSRELHNWFNYRIRIENVSDEQTIQLLGRNWHIQEIVTESDKSPSDEKDSDIVVVNAPNSGAVGQLPVLRPGDAFEYMSSCSLTTAKGVMSGSFHFAPVPVDTPSATVNVTVAAFSSPDRFHVEVKPFRLEAAISNSSSGKATASSKK